MVCGSQIWNIISDSERKINFRCNCCTIKASLSLTDEESGQDCPCSNDTWNITEKINEDVILSCTECERLSKLWLPYYI